MKHRRKKTPYEPWRADQSRSLRGWLIGLSILALAVALVLSGQAAIGMLAFAIGAVILSRSGRLAKRANSREFGKTLETQSSAKAIRYFAENGIIARANVLHRGLGDIDLLVHGNGHRVPIEIKSFRRWSQFFVFTGKRERDAIAQTRRQVAALHAPRGMIWLPQGKPSVLQWMFGAGAGSITVVFGSEKALLRAVNTVRGLQ